MSAADRQAQQMAAAQKQAKAAGAQVVRCSAHTHTP
jgi:hypothetical protein